MRNMWLVRSTSPAPGDRMIAEVKQSDSRIITKCIVDNVCPHRCGLCKEQTLVFSLAHTQVSVFLDLAERQNDKQDQLQDGSQHHDVESQCFIRLHNAYNARRLRAKVKNMRNDALKHCSYM